MKLEGELISLSNLGIMQGRLIDPPHRDDLDWFPFDNWENEFSIAQNLSFKSIELVVDRKMKKNNPIWDQTSRDRIKQLYDQYELKPIACCVNFVIDNSISDYVIANRVKDIIKYVSELDFNYIIIPLFGLSDLEFDRDNNINNNISLLANYANDKNVKLLIETNLSGDDTLNFLSKVKNKEVGVVYDIGNATGCGHNIEHDLNVLYGVISHVHIKDKNYSGENVPLGDGVVNFSSFFDRLGKIKYEGAFTLETSRGVNATFTAANNLNYLKEYF